MNDEEQRDHMIELARSFPCLRGAPGVDPFEPEELNCWAAGGRDLGVGGNDASFGWIRAGAWAPATHRSHSDGIGRERSLPTTIRVSG
jgi:hypothetical protein